MGAPLGDVYMIMSGAPGSGKTTLARGLATELGLPLLTKDTIKEALLGALDVPDVDASRRIGAAAIEVLIAVAIENGRGVLESVWRRSFAIEDLARLPAPCCEVFCRCPPELARRRFADRAGERAAGHFDAQRVDDDLWSGETAEPIAGPWPVIEVRTDRPVDVEALADQVRKQFAAELGT